MKSPEEVMRAYVSAGRAERILEALHAAGYKIVHMRTGAQFPETTARFANYGTPPVPVRPSPMQGSERG